MYTLEFFIRKAEAINPELWITGRYGTADKHCFLGWCGDRPDRVGGTMESTAVCLLFHKYGLNVLDINDYQSPQSPQPHPKDRIIATLYWIRGEMAVEQAQEIVNSEVGEVV